jgi:PTH1 family peptidyl-tRNA hydrolase
MIRLLVGLGNPGTKYASTRHNIGYEVVSRVARSLKAETQPPTVLYDWGVAEGPSGRVYLALPMTYMNRSGEAVSRLLADIGVESGRMLVVVDDYNLPLGAIRVRAGGSDGGHNGLASIIEVLAGEDFPRLRVGIGAPAEAENPADFVLSPFALDETEIVRESIAKAAETAIFALDHSLEEVMSRYNRNPAPPETD